MNGPHQHGTLRQGWIAAGVALGLLGACRLFVGDAEPHLEMAMTLLFVDKLAAGDRSGCGIDGHQVGDMACLNADSRQPWPRLTDALG